jgi:hypothetical protein
MTLTITTQRMNQLEPEELIAAFMQEPPEEFQPWRFDINGETCFGFQCALDLFTTVSENVKKLRQQCDPWLPGFVKRLLKPNVLFVGTSVSEYALLPNLAQPEALYSAWMDGLRRVDAPFLIVKDIPKQSPLLTERENAFSEALMAYLAQQGFLIFSGQALGYVPICFSSRDEYLKRLSSNRRSNIKRRLKMFSKVAVQEIHTGSPEMTEDLIQFLYALYLKVYNNSYIHFDKLTLGFFRKVLSCVDNHGVVFVFRTEQKIIGFSLCFTYQDFLVEKYIGCQYPDSREHNFYYLSWFYKLDYCLKHGLKTLIVGWTSPEIKAYLGAEFTQTYHAVYIKNPMLRWLGAKIRFLFESDRQTLEKLQSSKK